jgi:glyoxylase-like metal-dependent hydrolase (beta-lactamase superfamily II)
MASTQWHDFDTGTPATYALTGGSNIGMIVEGDRALMIDAGLDYDSARKAWRELDELGATLSGILITHGHADHFGGAGPVARRAGVPVYAPPLEGAFAEQPLLEPLFLFNGAAPIEELRSKFTLAGEGTERTRPLAPGPVSIADIPLEIKPLPGHAPEQVGVACGRTFYCGDAVFPEETLARHPILFCTDLDAWLETLTRLPDLPYDRFIAGHGDPVSDIAPRATATAERLREIRGLVYDAIREPVEPYDILRAIAAHYNVTFGAPQFFLLSFTTVLSALTSLQRANAAQVRMSENRVLWEAT